MALAVPRPSVRVERFFRGEPPEPRRIHDSVHPALDWLARNQNPDGSWRATVEAHDAGVTALALLAFMQAGTVHSSRGSHARVVRRGLLWLIAEQDPEGCIGRSGVEKYMLNHILGTLVLAEAYGWTGSFLFLNPLRKAVEFLLDARTPGAGWRYQSACGESDSFVTAWAVLALKSADLDGLMVPARAYDGARAWLDEVTDVNDGRVGYTFRGPRAWSPGRSEHYNPHETLTAAAVVARIYIDRNGSDPRLRQGCQAIVKDPPAGKDLDIDYMYWYWGSLATFLYDGPKGQLWSRWNPRMTEALSSHQNTDGSWDPVDRWSVEGGRVYATAINALTLLIATRHDTTRSSLMRPR